MSQNQIVHLRAIESNPGHGPRFILFSKDSQYFPIKEREEMPIHLSTSPSLLFALISLNLPWRWHSLELSPLRAWLTEGRRTLLILASRTIDHIGHRHCRPSGGGGGRTWCIRCSFECAKFLLTPFRSSLFRASFSRRGCVKHSPVASEIQAASLN